MEFQITLYKKPHGVFLFIDDDKDEHDLLEIAMKKTGLTNPIVNCFNGQEALNYLTTTKDSVFIVLCDLNMPQMDGLELKRRIEMLPELKTKAIPFVFHSNTSSTAEIKTAYSLNIQGFIPKSVSIEGTVSSLQRIVAMWTDVIHPKDLG
ncbi:MAG: response regulator [Bacteroidetes bacterium]|nr:response regulator [Bacteroidota bacterium]